MRTMASLVASDADATRRKDLLAVAALAAVLIAGTIYANLCFAVTDADNYRYFPPFEPRASANMNRHLGHEYFNVAVSLTEGRGFADPFQAGTGPTSWTPPVLPYLLASLLWVCRRNRDAVLVAVLILKIAVLTATGILVLRLVRRTCTYISAGSAVAVMIAIVVCHFRQCFQYAN